VHGDRVGGNVGRLTAISTLGSFAGTALIGYILMPFLPNSVTMYVTSAVLMAVTSGYFLGWGRQQISSALLSDSLFFAASDQPEMLLQNPPDLSTVHPICRQDVNDAYATILNADPRHGLVLTDDYNPVEYFDTTNREKLRRQLALSMHRR